MGYPTNLKSAAVDKLKSFVADDSNIEFAVLFGSHAAGRGRCSSDLDVAVYFKNPPHGFAFLTLVERLSTSVGRDVDVAVLNSSPAFLRHQVMKTGVVLIVKNQEAYRRFREKTITDYDEYSYVSGMCVYDR